MIRSFLSRSACAALLAGAVLPAWADSFTSSASSAGSASSGSVSASFHESSDSSTSSSRDKKTAYRIVEIVAVADRAGFVRWTLQGDEPAVRLWLDLPRVVVERETLAVGAIVEARPQVYGWAFARGGATDAFYLVLTDAWSDQLVARPVSS